MQTYIEKFILSKQAGGAAGGTITFYRRALLRFARHYPAWPPQAENIEQYMAKRREDVQPITANGDYRAISVFINWCCRRRFLKENPLEFMDRPRRVKTIPKPAKRGDIAKLFDAIDNAASQGDIWAIRDRALFRLAYDTGVRASELAGLLRVDLDLAANAIYITRKGGNRQFVFFGPKAGLALLHWTSVNPTGEYLFINQLGEPMTRRRIWVALKGWCKIAGVVMTVHQLRHSYATHAMRRGIDIRLVQAQMGHSSITTTAMYLGADDEERQVAHLKLAPGNDL